MAHDVWMEITETTFNEVRACHFHFVTLWTTRGERDFMYYSWGQPQDDYFLGDGRELKRTDI